MWTRPTAGIVLAVGIAGAALAGCTSTSSSSAAAPKTHAPAAVVSTSTDPLSSVYQDICSLLKDGGSQADVTAVVKNDMASADIPGYTAQDLVRGAEQKDCPQYLVQQQAVDAAQGYLNLGTGFSYASLLKQLTSSAGDGFSQADAKFAIGHLHPDWDAQAVEAAKAYLKLGGFSRASLLQQLTSAYGDQFTQAQAQYAVNQTMG